MDLLTYVWGDSSKLTREQQEAIRPFFLPEEYLSPVRKEGGSIDLIQACGDIAPGANPADDEVTLLLDDRLPIDAGDRGHPFTSEQVPALPRNVVIDKLREFSEDFEISLPPDLDDQGADALRDLLVEISDRDDVRKAWEEKRLKAALSSYFQPLFRQKTRNGLPTGEYLLEHPAVADYLRKKYRILSFNNAIYIYDKRTGIYRQNNNDLEEDIRRLVEGMNIRCSISKEARDILYHVRASNVFREYPFNQVRDLIPVKNGVIKIDLDAGAAYLLPHSSDNRFSFIIPVDYDPDIETGQMEEILRSWVMEEDIDFLIYPIAQAICQMQLKDTLKRSYIYQGSQNGGKSTCIEFMGAFLGTENITRASLHQICTERFIRGKMESRLLCSDDDLRGEELKNAGVFKKLTGGVYHGIENKGEKPYDGMIFCSFVFACNNPPKVDEETQYDSAFWSRWSYVIFPFYHPTNMEFKERVFTEQYFKQYLKLVVNKVIEIKQNRGKLPEVDTDIVKLRWTTQMDTIGQFIEECFSDDNARQKFDREAVFAYYLHWCKARKVDERRIADNLNRFVRDIGNHHFESAPTTIKNKDGRRENIRVLWGKYRIREDPEIGLPDGYTLESFSPSSKTSKIGFF